MFTKVSVLVPTRGRPEKLYRMLESYAMSSTGFSELIFRIDRDDVPTRTLLEAYPHKVVVGDRVGYHGMAQMVNELYAVADGDVLMVGNDDMWFETKGWDALVIDAANDHKDGVFCLGYNTFNQYNFPFITVSKTVADHFGALWPAGVKWIDVFWRDVMNNIAENRAVILPYVKIEHEWMGWTPDQTFIEGNQSAIYAADPAYFAEGGTHNGLVALHAAELKELIA